MWRAALARHPLAIAGALLATISAVAFIALAIGMAAGWFPNPYAGLVVFGVVPAFFVAGLLLIPFGMWLQRRKLARHPEAASDWPVIDLRITRVRRIALLVVALTVVNASIVLLAAYGGLHYMETPTFCGQACHTPMQPQFTAWREGPHGQVACVTCHIGEGLPAMARAKLNGLRQLAHVATNSYPRPIPPGAEMPPGAQAETCSGCHQPGRVVGDRIRVLREYADDEANSETVTVLQMYVNGSPSTPRAIHWHADPANRVEYVATDHSLQTIPYVKVTDAQGRVKEYFAADANGQVPQGERRTMDCMDCHNTVGHPISPTPEKAVDGAIAAGLISPRLPYVRRDAVPLLTAAYANEQEAAGAIQAGFKKLYSSRSDIDPKLVSQAANALEQVYRRNVFPDMKVTFGSYPTNRGHMTSTGCLRCHDESHTAKDNTTISGDCEYCHKQIEKPS